MKTNHDYYILFYVCVYVCVLFFVVKPKNGQLVEQ